MDNNSFSNLLDSTKSTGQPVYRCGLCLKEFLYYRDLAVHERVHLEQMAADRLQESVRPAYDNRSGLYNTPTVPITTLDSFDKLVQPFRGELDMRVGHADIRSTVPTSSAPEMDKVPPVYRTETDNRNVPLSSRVSPADSRELNMDMRSLPIDNRALSLDSRSITLDSRNIQPLDSRPLAADARSLPVDTRSLPYSTTSYMDSINPSMYSTDHHNKIPTSTPPAFQVQPGLRPDDYLAVSSRNQTLPKLDSQVFSKPDPYYGISKAHYSSLGSVEKPHPNYAPTQYGLTKLLGQAPSPYYPQPLVGQDQPKYDMDKIPSQSSLSYYNQPVNSQADPKLEKRQPSPSPKQTLYYGQPPVPTLPVTMATNSQYQINLPKPSHLHFQNTRELLNKPFPEKTEMGKSYQSGHASPHLTYTDIYKGSQSQSQVFTPVPSQSAPAQHDYSFYKLSSDPLPPVSMESKPLVGSLSLQECECYICFAPFPNMNELSEHMKIHARENIAMETPAQVGHQYPQSSAVSTGSVGVMNRDTSSVAVERVVSVNNSVHISSSNPLPPRPPQHAPSVAIKAAKDNLSCQACGKTFLKPSHLAEHVKVHTVEQQQHFECKMCKKDFNKLSKCTRHEALHQRNITLFYCEICEKDFAYKGNYLYHVQVEHTKGPVESTFGSKAAVVNFEFEKIVDCQICDEEVVKDKLVDHLKSHTVHTCDKCDRVFVQKTEYVEHLMADHWQELADSSDTKSGSENSDNERDEAKSERIKEESEEKDSGLEEDHEKDKEDMEAEETTGNVHVESARKNIKSSSGRNMRAKVDEKVSHKQNKEKAEKFKNKKEKKETQLMESVKKKKESTDLKEKKETHVGKEGTEDENLENEKGFVKETKFKFSCSKCEESFERKTDLAQHVEVHTRDPYKVYCEVCNTSFAVREKGYYIYHMKQHSDGDLDKGKHPEKFMCNVCYSEIRRENYVSHIIQEHTQFSCDICQWSYSSETSLFNHMRKIHSSSKVKYILKKGGGIEVQHKNVPVVYKKLKDIAPADNDADPGSPQNSFTCKVCSKTFNRKSSIENHMKKHNVKTTEQQMNCEICNAPFANKGTYFYHISQDHENSEAVVPRDERQHYERETKVESVSKGTKAESEEQMQRSTGKSFVTVLNPETGDLEEKVVEDEMLEKHNADSEKDSTSSKAAMDVVSEIIYCKLCNKCLKRDTLYEHMKEHTLFNCDLCKFSFTKKAQYIHHRKMLHVDEIVTAEIERAEAEEKLLNKATESGKRKRTDLIKLCTCPVCSAEFRQDKYVEHIKSHKVVLQCRFCGRNFSKKNLLAIHEKSHERISHEKELPFARNCPVCNAGIVSRVNYVQHLGEHLKQKPYSCKMCNKEFIGEKILENHTRLNHDKNIRVFWTLDGEGMKFDMRTGRYSEAASDYLCEIRELNEIMKTNKKPEVWLSTTPKKTKEKGANTSINKPQNTKYIDDEEALKMEDENEPANADTSDEDYLPDKKRKTYSSDADDDDEDYRPSSKKKKKKRLTFSADDDLTSEEEYSHKVTRTRHPAVTVSKKSLQRLRQLRVRKKMKVNQKKKPKRFLRSAIPSANTTKEISENKSNSTKDSDSTRKKMKRKVNEDKKASDNSETPKKSYKPTDVNMTPEQLEQYRLKPDQPFPKNCPVCNLHIYGRRNYQEHFLTHTGEKPHKCPYCDVRFTREWNMAVHAQNIHKVKSPLKSAAESPATLKAKEVASPSTTPVRESKTATDKNLRTRAKNIIVEDPVLSSTPVKMSKVTVRISPLQVEENKKLDKAKSSEKKSTPKSKTLANKNGSEKKQNALFVCEYCNKQINNNWNYSQHVDAHKKELKKKEKESKPFTCKTCAESFKKKRDLYIHTKVHSGNALDDDDSIMDVSKTESEINDTGNVSFSSSVQDSDISVLTESIVKDTGGVVNTHSIDIDDRRMSNSGSSTGLNGKTTGDKVYVQDSVKDRNMNSESLMEKDNNSSDSKDNNNKPDSGVIEGLKDNTTNTKFGEIAAVNTSTSSKTSETNSKPTLAAQFKGNNCENVTTASDMNTEDLSNEQVAFTGDRSIKKGSPFSVESDDVELPNNSLKNDLTHRNSNNDNRRLSDSETEDKVKSTKTPPPVKKMSSELALSKWKMKVQATLSSQLELNAAKQQEEIENPEIAKVKERLAIKGKSEKKKYECRICGDAFDLESVFRQHMELHLNESPPYCGICDIYFMAIYPKRRLMEHNKKKHPELQS